MNDEGCMREGEYRLVRAAAGSAYLENLSRINQPLTVGRRVRLLRNSLLEILHGLIYLYRDL